MGNFQSLLVSIGAAAILTAVGWIFWRGYPQRLGRWVFRGWSCQLIDVVTVGGMILLIALLHGLASFRVHRLLS